MSNHLYWRLYITEGFGASGNLGYYAISEIEMRATSGGADQCNGGTATAHDSYSATYAPSKAFDNLISSTWWASYTNNPVDWIKYAFASAVDVTELAITNRNLTTNYPPKSFKLQWSDN
ncbi:MAG: discoidin domain-containing protein, partial [Magnetococcales bacterium]|nr:discoidin domain-containing protein [Magnetococcales bacterium]